MIWKLLAIWIAIDDKFAEQFGFRMKDTTIKGLINYMHAPKDSSSLAVTRILFGLAMLFDIPHERGGSVMDKRWGDAKICHFPLLPFLQPLPMPYIAIVYLLMWLGALGIMLGYKFRLAAATFTAGHWYLLLIEKSYWNNHSYLFGLVALLLTCTQANCFWSIDAYKTPKIRQQTVPYWNYFVLKYQFFILYFMAGLKKGTTEWLTGYSVQNLSEHWVFDPFKWFLTVSQTDYLIVHWFVFAFDLTVAIWMMWSRTRHYAIFFCAMFHLMNSRLFRIGMFPWVCLATMPLFYPFNWPKIVLRIICTELHEVIFDCYAYIMFTSRLCYIIGLDYFNPVYDDDKSIEGEITSELSHEDVNDKTDGEVKSGVLVKESNIKHNLEMEKKKEKKMLESSKDINDNRGLTCLLILVYVFIQAFLPFSHFITKGYNNWTNGLYGYSWDMMVHTWDVNSVLVKIVDNEKNKEFYIDPNKYVPNQRWTRHGDMVHQYAHCVKDILLSKKQNWNNPPALSNNISIYVDVWCAMNGRFIQRLFDPKVDILQAQWSPFRRVPYLMDILDEDIYWRSKLDEIKEDVHSWNNLSDVLFMADFPGYEQERFITAELTNVTLSVLNGTVLYEEKISLLGQSYKLTAGDRMKVESEVFHRVLNIGDTPSYYMYTFYNITDTLEEPTTIVKIKLPILKELYERCSDMLVFANLVIQSIFQMCFQACFWMPHCPSNLVPSLSSLVI